MEAHTWEHLSDDMIDSINQDTKQRNHRLQNYYRLHSNIYDWTRWSFLFGREKLLNKLPDLPPRPRILEIGCGTGQNLRSLELLFPDAKIYGIDLSTDMIEQAQKKVDNNQQIELINGVYGEPHFDFEPFNLILLSYSLTMLGSQAEDIMQQVHTDLTSNGYIAVVDFDATPFGWFRKWMKINHVDLDGHLPLLLNKFFSPLVQEDNDAYGGLWSYLIYIGQRK